MNGYTTRIKNIALARRILPLCLCFIVGAGALTPAFAQSKDVINRLDRLENELQTLNRAVYKGEAPPAGAMGGGGSEASGELLDRVQRMESEIRDLTGKVEQQSYDMQQIQQKLDALSQDAGMRLDAVEAQLRAQPPQAAVAPQAPVGMPPQPATPMTDVSGSGSVMVDPSVMVTGNETGADATDATGLYEQGFGEIKQQNYDAAEKTFASFIKKYPEHALSANAYYWLGETYYVRKDYEKASRVFAEAYKKYPKGPKGADNLLKLGMSLAGQGKKDDACIALGQLRKQYPDGPAPVMNKADQERTTLGCS